MAKFFSKVSTSGHEGSNDTVLKSLLCLGADLIKVETNKQILDIIKKINDININWIAIKVSIKLLKDKLILSKTNKLFMSYDKILFDLV